MRVPNCAVHRHWGRALGSGQAVVHVIGGQPLLVLVCVEVLAIHVCIFGNALLAGLARDEGSAHGAGDDARGDDEDSGSQDYPAAPCQVRDK